MNDVDMRCFLNQVPLCHTIKCNNRVYLLPLMTLFSRPQVWMLGCPLYQDRIAAWVCVVIKRVRTEGAEIKRTFSMIIIIIILYCCYALQQNTSPFFISRQRMLFKGTVPSSSSPSFRAVSYPASSSLFLNNRIPSISLIFLFSKKWQY